MTSCSPWSITEVKRRRIHSKMTHRRWPKARWDAMAYSRPSICKPSAHRNMLRSNSRRALRPHLRHRAPASPRLLIEDPLSTAPNPSDFAISLHNISKFFGRVPALRDVTASFSCGRLYTILGENGAGKSTLLRLLAGLATPSSGSVQVFDAPPREPLHLVGYMAHAAMLE